MKYMMGRKLNMTQVFKGDGTVVPVTRISVSPLTVTQVKTAGDKTVAVQLGCEVAKKVSKPIAGHLQGLPLFRVLKEFATNQSLKRGDIISIETFKEGDHIDAIGTSKGKGFAGVVKRHGFHGGPASHGHKDNLRAPGAIGAGGVQRVFKGVRMAGHMGDARITVKNLEIVSVDTDNNEILVKGAVPGARGGLVIMRAEGDFIVKEVSTEASVEVPVEVTEATDSSVAVPEDAATESVLS